jgi:hypothetical protein
LPFFLLQAAPATPPPTTSTAPSTTTTSTTTTTTTTTTTEPPTDKEPAPAKEQEKKEKEKPQHVIPAHDLRHLANVLTLDSCTEFTYQNTLSLLTHLARTVESNKQVLLTELSHVAEVLGDMVTKKITALNERLAERALPPFVALDILPFSFPPVPLFYY